MRKALLFLTNLLLFAVASSIIYYFWQLILFKPYVFAKTPVGGDYFNALTYAKFIYDNRPFPPTAWLPFWNEGWPLIGGYPWVFFYFLIPLVKFMSLAKSMEVVSAFLLLLYFISSLLLFWKASKNVLVGLAFSLITIYTQATYYQLVTVGSIVSSGIQWILPMAIFLSYSYEEKRNMRLLVLMGILIGFAFLYHSPEAFLTILLPTGVFLLTYNAKGPKQRSLTKLKDLFILILISLLAGSMGVYTLLIQIIEGVGIDRCTSPECWGVYPRHLITWLNPLAPVAFAILIIVAIVIKIFRKKLSLKSLLPSTLAFLVIIVYAVLAKLKVINGLANAIFPTRTFWSLNTLLLLMAAATFFEIRKQLFKISFLISVFLLAGAFWLLVKTPPEIHTDRSNTSPSNVANYIIPDYEAKSRPSDLIPSWMPLNDQNYRLDTFDEGIAHWWNYLATTPSVRGYSNFPVGTHRDWQYLLQLATRDPKVENVDLVRNKALYYINEFGIGYRENSIASYPSVIISDRKIASEPERFRDLIWFNLSKSQVSPIISATNSPEVLVLGDREGYKTFIRAISMFNLNSNIFIPVNGPTEIDSLGFQTLKRYDSVILYNFKSGNWSSLEKYVENGGTLIISSPIRAEDLKGYPSSLIPFGKLNVSSIKGYAKLKKNIDSNLFDDVNLSDFSPFIYQGADWGIAYGDAGDLKKDTTPLLSTGNKIVLAEIKIGKGRVIWSGLNLPYHAVINENYEESKLFRNIITSTFPIKKDAPVFSVTRNAPNDIFVYTQNAKGVYFKENYHSGWKVKINDKKGEVLDAGLDFMYVPIPENLEMEKLKMELYFSGSFDTWGFFLISLVGFFVSFLYLITPRTFVWAFHRTLSKHQVLISWWDKDES